MTRKFIVEVKEGKTPCGSRCPAWKQEPHCGGGVYMGDLFYFSCLHYDLTSMRISNAEEDKQCE